MKYIAYELSDGRRMPFIFPEVFTHAVVLKALDRILSDHLSHGQPVAAGNIEIKSALVWGQAEGIGLAADELDAAFLCEYEKMRILEQALIALKADCLRADPDYLRKNFGSYIARFVPVKYGAEYERCATALVNKLLGK